MRIAIVHYHLRQGGVSQIIAASSRALTAAGVDHVILVGEAPDPGMADLPVRVIPGLAYHAGPDALTVETLRAAAEEALGQPPDVWHFHNHSLGKNAVMPRLVARLAGENEPLMLHIHDLAEDGRPGSYPHIADCAELYPVSARICYVFLNARDQDTFREAGLPDENSLVLENPILPPAHAAQVPSGSALCFAPVRGIRRKNLGELVFLSAIAPVGTRFAVSRAPLNPEALPVHDHWRKFARRHGLPIGFAVVDRCAPGPGAGSDFASWIAHSTHFITTSVAEGFGLPFLEAAAHGRPLIGRNLPHITAGHARHGIHSGDLYEQLLIPTDWIDPTILRDHLTTTLERNFRCYGSPLSRNILEAAFAALDHGGWLDFGNLPEPLQQGVIERLADKASRAIPRVRTGGTIHPATDWLAAALANRTPAAAPGQLAPYSLALYQKQLAALYSRLRESPASAVRFLPAAAILTKHLAPASFHFLLSALKAAPVRSLRHRAVIFDIYGTLLIAPPGGVKPDPAADPVLRSVITHFGHTPPESPSTALHAAVFRHHAAAACPFPEIDLRVLWREVLSLPPGTDTAPLVTAIEHAWHPARLMPGVADVIGTLAAAGVSLGLLSNAQCNTLASLGGLADLFAPELTILSYQHHMAKPSPELFRILADRLAGRGISPGETLFVGNDPLHDIVPAAASGFQTALFTGHPESLRPGDCPADFRIRSWRRFPGLP